MGPRESLSAYLKAKELQGFSPASFPQCDLGQQAESWLRDVLGEVTELQIELQYFCGVALAHRAPKSD